MIHFNRYSPAHMVPLEHDMWDGEQVKPPARQSVLREGGADAAGATACRRPG